MLLIPYMMQNSNQQTGIKTFIGKRNPLSVIDNNRSALVSRLDNIKHDQFVSAPRQRTVIKTPPASDIQNPASRSQNMFKKPDKPFRPAVQPQTGAISNHSIKNPALKLSYLVDNQVLRITEGTVSGIEDYSTGPRGSKESFLFDFWTLYALFLTAMERSLKGKTALITGSSRGIGRATAFQLARRGAAICINYVRNEEAARSTAGELESLGVKTAVIQANVGDPKAAEALVEETASLLGPPDILIHNAALGAFKPVHKLRLNQWDLSLDVNAKAFLVLAQKTAPLMESRGGGCMIALSSLGSRRFIPHYGAIGISKAALECLIRYLAVELAPRKIRVNGVSGGLVETDALKAFPEYETFRREVIKRTPAGKIADPDDLAAVVAFLTTPEAAWIVGQTLIADGGLSLI